MGFADVAGVIIVVIRRGDVLSVVEYAYVAFPFVNIPQALARRADQRLAAALR
jgi:hypothetical protein